MYDSDLCNDCGKCCHIPVIMGGKPKTMRKIVCRFLEVNRSEPTKTRCSVYHQRFRKAPWCMSIPEAISQGRLPKDCPYVADDPEYKESVEYLSPVEEDVVMYVPHQFIDIKTVSMTKPWQGPMGE